MVILASPKTGPFAEAEVRGDDDAGPLIELVQHMEEQGPTRGAEGQVSTISRSPSGLRSIWHCNCLEAGGSSANGAPFLRAPGTGHTSRHRCSS